MTINIGRTLRRGMKNLKKKAAHASLALLLAAAMFSCHLQETNVNPNNSTDAPVSAILTGGEASLAFASGSDIIPITNIFVQQFAGANGDASAYENYVEGPNRYDQIWNDVYATPLKNLSIVLKKSRASNSPYYAAIARILLVQGFGTLTDIFGDIPYSQALQGLANELPAYDRQLDIYTNLQAQLDTAILELSRVPDTFTTPPPGNDDVIYQGNVARWTAAAWTLKARYALHLTKIDSVDAATKALSYSAKGISSNLADLQVNFGNSATNSNPFYQIQTFRRGWLGLDAAFVNLLNGNKTTDPSTKAATSPVDPRRSYFANPTIAGGSVYRGFKLGESGAISYLGPYLATPTAPIIFASNVENKFIEAEARLRLNPADPLAQQALKDAISASFTKVVTNGADTNATQAKRDAYINANATLSGDFRSDLEKIITQKYIALFGQSEVWVDYRRTGFPVLTPPPGSTHGANPNGQIPRRALYPATEQLQNPNIPTLSSTHQEPRLWWDKE